MVHPPRLSVRKSFYATLCPSPCSLSLHPHQSMFALPPPFFTKKTSKGFISLLALGVFAPSPPQTTRHGFPVALVHAVPSFSANNLSFPSLRAFYVAIPMTFAACSQVASEMPELLRNSPTLAQRRVGELSAKSSSCLSFPTKSPKLPPEGVGGLTVHFSWSGTCAGSSHFFPK